MAKESWITFDTTIALPTLQEDMRGQLRFAPPDPANAASPDRLLLAGRDQLGALRWWLTNALQIKISPESGGDGSVYAYIDSLSIDTRDFNLGIGLTNAISLSKIDWQYHTLGPFHLNDVPGTAVTGMTLEFFNTASATSIGTTGAYYAPADGYICGAYLNSDASRTAGSAVLRPTINGTGQVMFGGNPTLDATNALRHAMFNTREDALLGPGITFTAGQRIGCELVTSGWTPITADVTALLVIAMSRIPLANL